MKTMANNTTLEQITQKVEKLFALAGNNPSVDEAQAALLKAQELMAKYNLSQDMLYGKTSIHIVEKLTTVKATKFNIFLAITIAKSFACRAFLTGTKASNKKIAFFGKTCDVEAAAAAQEFISRIMHKGGLKAVHAAGLMPMRAGANIPYNSYCYGFVRGVKDCLDEQTTALAIVVSEEVNSAYKEKFEGGKTYFSRSVRYRNDETFSAGYADGKSAMKQNRELQRA